MRTGEEADGMVRTRARWIRMLALVGVLVGFGCSSGSDGAQEAQVPDGQTAANESPSQDLTSALVMTSAELVERLEGQDAPVVLDVRSPEEFAEGHIPGAINVPYDQVAASLDSLESFRAGEIVVYCRTGRRAGVAENVLREAGFTQVFDLEGHMTSWSEADLPLAVPAADCC